MALSNSRTLPSRTNFRKFKTFSARSDANNPDRGDVISNPYALAIQGNTAFVTDAGANDLLSVGLDGSNLKAVL